MTNFTRIIYVGLITISIMSLLYLPGCKFFKKDRNRTLNVIACGGTISANAISDFEKTSGIKINLQSYSTDEELVAKMKKTKGKGWDVLFPSDYGVKLLSDEGLIKPLKKNKLDFLKEIEPYLLNHEFDPLNHYSLPYAWEVCGLAVNQEKVANQVKPTLAQLFNPNLIDYKIVMPPHPLESIFLGAYYLNKDLECFIQEGSKEIYQLLKSQKPLIEAYADFRATHLITSECCPIALLKSSYINQIVEENPKIEFLIPIEGCFTSIESVTIGANCNNEEAAYQFINYFYKPEVMAKQINTWAYFPAVLKSLEHTSKFSDLYYRILNEAKEQNDLIFFYYFLPPEEINKLWTEIKS